LYEFYFDIAAVNIAMEIEEMNFDYALRFFARNLFNIAPRLRRRLLTNLYHTGTAQFLGQSGHFFLRGKNFVHR
jgi:hypothetical protein